MPTYTECRRSKNSPNAHDMYGDTRETLVEATFNLYKSFSTYSVFPYCGKRGGELRCCFRMRAQRPHAVVVMFLVFRFLLTLYVPRLPRPCVASSPSPLLRPTCVPLYFMSRPWASTEVFAIEGWLRDFFSATCPLTLFYTQVV